MVGIEVSHLNGIPNIILSITQLLKTQTELGWKLSPKLLPVKHWSRDGTN